MLRRKTWELFITLIAFLIALQISSSSSLSLGIIDLPPLVPALLDSLNDSELNAVQYDDVTNQAFIIDANRILIYSPITNNFTVLSYDSSALAHGSSLAIYRPASSTAAGASAPFAGQIFVSDISFHYIVALEVDPTNISSNETNLTQFAGVRFVFGFQNGPRLASLFNKPSGIAFDPACEYLYVSDQLNGIIRRIEMATGIVSTFAGGGLIPIQGPLLGVLFNSLTALTFASPTVLYVTDGNAIQMINMTQGTVSLHAGGTLVGPDGYLDGLRTVATFGNALNSLHVDLYGNLYVADTTMGAVRVIHGATGNVTTLYYSADGTGGSSGLGYPFGVTVLRDGSMLILARASLMSTSEGRILRIGCDEDPVTFYRDADGDLYPNLSEAPLLSCIYDSLPPLGYIRFNITIGGSRLGDCNDSDPLINLCEIIEEDSGSSSSSSDSSFDSNNSTSDTFSFSSSFNAGHRNPQEAQLNALALTLIIVFVCIAVVIPLVVLLVSVLLYLLKRRRRRLQKKKTKKKKRHQQATTSSNANTMQETEMCSSSSSSIPEVKQKQ